MVTHKEVISSASIIRKAGVKSSLSADKPLANARPKVKRLRMDVGIRETGSGRVFEAVPLVAMSSPLA